MQDMKFLRDLLVSGGIQANSENAAEEVMRLAQDPLLLHEHLQAMDSGGQPPRPAHPDSKLEVRLQKLTDREFDRRSTARASAATSRYVLRDKLVDTSLHPETFAVTGEDKTRSIDHEVHAIVEQNGEHAIPPNLIICLLIVCCILLTAAAIIDLSIAG